jgi:hypothetical protein
VDKKILFPFSLDKDFHRGYAWTMELATRMNATLYFFTSIPDQQTEEKYLLKHIYHALLSARGNYLRYFQSPAKSTAIARTERCIEKGEFNNSLIQFVMKTRFDIVVVDPNASGITLSTIKGVVENSSGVIVLPDQEGLSSRVHAGPIGEIRKNVTENFFETLRQSDLYKLRTNFFLTLGQDKRLFNYLRCFFGKNLGAWNGDGQAGYTS